MIEILLVEDNPIDAILLKRSLENSTDSPVRVNWLDDGQKALTYLSRLESTEAQKPPAIVLLDVNLPKHDGLTILEKFRKSPKACHAPVFLMSSAPPDQIAAMAKSRSLRADGYIEKVMGLSELEQLASRIREFAGASFSEAKTVAA